MRVLIIGYGSIGRRHARILSQLGVQVSLVTTQIIDSFKCHRDLGEALQDGQFDYIIIANITSLHYKTLLDLIKYNYSGIILVEKPLFMHFCKLPGNFIKNVFVAYNLRFSIILQRVHHILRDRKLISMSVHTGQYLPDWRIGMDYRKSYSASKSKGGGVLRDLSHELDYINWFCGKCIKLVAKGGRYGNLEIDSDDTFAILMQYENCSVVTIELSYLTKIPKREILLHTDRETIYIDLISGILRINDKIETYNVDRDDTYIAQHRALLEGQYDKFCSYDEGLYVLKLIAAIEQANTNSNWVTL